jgi:benzylsuccinate CoA-transferase BbsF subunit
VPRALDHAREIFAASPGRERLRIADFSWVGVGPISTQLMAFLGAEVIRIESTERLDVFRSSGPKRGPDPDASGYWANCNRDKLAMTLNLKRPGAREVALDLAATSDVLVESFTPGFLASVGLSYDDVRAVNPSIIMMSCSMEGAWGPHAQYRGFGLTLQSAAGITHFTSWPDRAPVGTGVAYTDWFATNIAALALLVALDHRDRTGEGQYIDLSQLEACMWALDAELFRVAADGSERPPLGNRHPAMAPHGVFPCRGDEAWIAIAIRHDRDWAALARVIAEPWCDDPALATLDGDDLAARLQAAGVPAYPVRDMAGVAHDPQLNARGHFWELAHAAIGPARWDAPAYRLSRTPITPGAPAPLLGEHNDHVYRALLGYSDDAIAALIATGVME